MRDFKNTNLYNREVKAVLDQESNSRRTHTVGCLVGPLTEIKDTGKGIGFEGERW